MSTFTKVPLSGSTDGRPILVAATSSPGTTIHTADASAVDEIWIYATNNHTAALALTLQWGGTTAPDDAVTLTLAAQSGLTLIIPGLILRNSLVVKAYAGTTNLICLAGFVNRIS